MRWVEIINLRSSSNGHKELIDGVLAGITESDFWTADQADFQEIRTYHQPLLETDVSIHICWESRAGQPSRSTLASRIYSALMREGLLDYSIWVERASRGFSHRPEEKS